MLTDKDWKLNEQICLLTLAEVRGVGNKILKTLTTKFKTANEVFKQNTIDGISPVLMQNILNAEPHISTYKEIDFINARNVAVDSLFSSTYPLRLSFCNDAPFLLFYEGKILYPDQPYIAIVGTRQPTAYGKTMVKRIIKELKPYNPVIVSGLAYGIDTSAHEAALENGLATIAVLGSGLDEIYPNQNKRLAERIQKNGALLTEHYSHIMPKKENFPKRNRIIAGLCEATFVVEGAITGGALITGRLAMDYNRDVFALPGRVGEVYSEGPNYLIKTNVAHLAESGEDIAKLMGWKQKQDESNIQVQKEIFVALSENQKKLLQILKDNKKHALDAICFNIKLPVSVVLPTLLELEMQGLVESHPGKMYKIA